MNEPVQPASVPASAATPKTSPAPRRRRWLRITLIVTAILVVVLAVLPTIASGFAGSYIESNFAASHMGRLAVGELSLGWFSRQRVDQVRIVEPNGNDVAVVSVELPSLLSLLAGLGNSIGKVQVRGSADLVADAEGVTNLDRALAPRGSREPEASPKSSGDPTDLGAMLRKMELEVDLGFERITWSDARTRALGTPISIDGLASSLVVLPGQPLRLLAGATIAGSKPGQLRLEATFHDLFDASGLSSKARYELDLAIDALPSALVDTLAQQDGLVAAALGSDFRVSAKGAGTLDAGEVNLEVVGERGTIRSACRLTDGVLLGTLSAPGGGEGEAVQIALRPDRAALDRLLLRLVPEGLVLTPIGDSQLDVAVADLRIGIRPILDALNGKGDVTKSAVAASELSLRVAGNGWLVTGSKIPLAQGVAWHAPRVDARLAAVAPAVARRFEMTVGGDISGGLEDPGRAPMSIVVTCPDVSAIDFKNVLAVPAAKVDAKVARLSTSLVDAFAGNSGKLASALGKEIGFQVGVTATQDEDARLNLALKSALTGDRGETAMDAVVAIDDPLGRLTTRPAGALPTAEATFTVKGLAVIDGFVDAELAVDLHELLGDSFAGKIQSRPADGSAGFENVTLGATLAAARVDLKIAGRLQDGALRIAGEPFVLEVRPTTGMIDRHVGTKLPVGAKLGFATAEPAITLRADAVDLPLDAWLVPEGKTARSLADVLRAAAARVVFELPNLVYTPQPAAGATTVPTAIDALAIEATLAAAAPTVIDIRGAIGGSKAGAIAMQATLADIGAFVDRAEGAPLPPVAVAGDITSLPTALVDAIAGQDGLLLDTLGPEMNLTLRGAHPSPTDSLRAELKSSSAAVTLIARLDGQILAAEGEQGLDVRVPLTPLFSKRIVGNLVPLLVHASKPAGAAPVELTMRAFRLSLDGDMRQLNGTVELDLGEIGYQLLPGLSEHLAAAGLANVANVTTKLPKLTIPIKDGVAGYDALPVSIGGRSYVFKGTFDLASSEMNFATELPLSILGKKLSKELEKARDYLDPQMMVPIELKGSWSKPRLGLGDKFLRDVAESALKRGLFDILRKKDGK